MEQPFRSFDAKGEMIRTGRDDRGRVGVVSAGREEAGRVGRQILEAGGNAIDAAVAVGFAMGVCEPNANGLGGGGFMLLRDGHTGETAFIDFRETAPAGAHPHMWRRTAEGKAVDDENKFGGKSVATPGETAGLLYALETYGTMTPQQVIAPAVRLAREGFVVTPLLHRDIAENQDYLMKYGTGHEIYLPGGAPAPVGTVLKNPQLADTLEAIAQGERDAFYRGTLAEKMVAQVKKDGGILTLQDLEAYQVRVYPPVRGTYRGYEILSSPPPSSGGTHVLEILNVLEHFDLSAMAYGSREHLHLLSEVFKLCYADRAAYMGDPNYVKVPLSGLLSKTYAGELAARVDLVQAGLPAPGNPWEHESTSTTHVSIADRSGNLVAMTKTINHFFGSCVVPAGTGFILNDQMEDFDVDPASPNRAEGGKKPLSCMSPTFILKDGKPVAVLGSPGGIRIIGAVAQVISNLIDFGMDVEAAVSAPRMGDGVNNLLVAESRFPADSLRELEAMGHTVRSLGDWNRAMGGVNTVAYQPDGTLWGMADPRRDGKAVAF